MPVAFPVSSLSNSAVAERQIKSQEKARFFSLDTLCNIMDLNSKIGSLSRTTMEIFNNNN